MQRPLRFAAALASCALVAFAMVAVACGGDDSSPAESPTPVGPAPDAGRTEEALAAAFSHLANALLAQGDVPEGYTLRVSEPVSRSEVAAANVGIPRLAGFVQNSEMQGAWASFYLRDQPQTGLTSIIFEFETPESAQAFVEAIAGLTAADYPEAIAVERVQSDKIEDAAQMMLYRLAGGRTYDYTWAQGRFAGQIVLRYSGNVDEPTDRSLMLSLARKQAELMREVAQ